MLFSFALGIMSLRGVPLQPVDPLAYALTSPSANPVASTGFVPTDVLRGCVAIPQFGHPRQK